MGHSLFLPLEMLPGVAGGLSPLRERFDDFGCRRLRYEVPKKERLAVHVLTESVGRASCGHKANHS